ncbi:MAG: hypothetical protein O7B80_03710, partial [bacterium]|nr:hypothetical protein [bacterium]
MRKWAALIAGFGLLAIEKGLDVSGVVNMPLAIGLWIFGGGLLTASGIMFAWPAVKKRKPMSRVVVSEQLTTIGKEDVFEHLGRLLRGGNNLFTRKVTTNEEH